MKHLFAKCPLPSCQAGEASTQLLVEILHDLKHLVPWDDSILVY